MINKMTQRYLETIKTLILRELKDESVTIGLFGSFAEGSNTEVSDIDIAVIPKGQWNRWKLSSVREKLEELTVPYTVDIVDFSNVSEQFRQVALNNVLWWRE